MQELEQVNGALKNLLDVLTHTAAEDEATEKLIADLGTLVTCRQQLLDELFTNTVEVDKHYLHAQKMLTHEYAKQSCHIKEHLQSLLHLSAQKKRQINLYQKIDANR